MSKQTDINIIMRKEDFTGNPVNIGSIVAVCMYNRLVRAMVLDLDEERAKVKIFEGIKFEGSITRPDRDPGFETRVPYHRIIVLSSRQ